MENMQTLWPKTLKKTLELPVFPRIFSSPIVPVQ